MAYYLGRDVDIAITTESAYYGVGELIGTATNSAICLDFRRDLVFDCFFLQLFVGA